MPQEQLGDRAPYRAAAARRAGDQNGICHIFLPMLRPVSSGSRTRRATISEALLVLEEQLASIGQDHIMSSSAVV
jgi:hypothetical protein